MSQYAPPTAYEDIAKMIDHSLLRPELSEAQVAEGCRVARDYDVASVCVRPADLEYAVRAMEGSGVAVGSVAGFPHGSQTIAVKVFEARELVRGGATEVDMVLNIGRLVSRNFRYIESELAQMARACHEGGAILKVIFENAYLTDDLKIAACRIATGAGCDFVKTSTGFAPGGATIEDLRLMRQHAGPNVRVKAAGGVRTLDQALAVREAGCARFGATATAAILDEWRQRLGGAAHA